MTDFKLIPFKVEPTNDVVEDIPPGIKMIKAPELWKQGYKGKGVVIAVVDSGCDVNHPNLKERIIAKRNFVLSEETQDIVIDKSGHGTHVAGTIAASDNGSGVIGVAPEADLVIVKVMEEFKSPSGKISYGASNQVIIDAIHYCIEWNENGKRIDVINMSFGGSQYDPELHRAIKAAVNKGILVVCAAGNEGDLFSEGDSSSEKDEYSYPGSHPEVVSVGAVKLDGKPMDFPNDFSNTNYEVDLVAPGVDILSTLPGNTPDGKPNTGTMSGTSMACPHVAGAAALMINYCNEKFGRKLPEPEIYTQLIKRTDFREEDPKRIGNGLLDLSMGLHKFA
ncbi:S8 family peptidase [Paenibacillus polymyxa]|uniref:S8 family peptidase n=1 Tax=Paenibacillus polymyxa TaxID=1406 RepID=UPI002AB5A677|nr:S8 family peptidase [Paenibacillus polymyxa]MDY7989834.1 S8 family peptidase [Paenibacillus polymyxa]MDY8116807.1 S8 family peptidase [Paenibacillus polymyxa]